MAREITGDSPKSVNTESVSMLPFAHVSQAVLASASSPINDTTKSGKQPGGAVLVKLTTGGQLVIAIAQGSAATDKWVIQGMDAAGLIEITPA